MAPGEALPFRYFAEQGRTETAKGTFLSLRLVVLALGTFAIGTGSFVFAGLLGDVAEDLEVSVGAAGQLITVYAVVYAVGSPVLVTLTGGVPRRPHGRLNLQGGTTA